MTLHHDLHMARLRIARLEEALKPFAKAGELFGPREIDGFDMLVYGPAAGGEYNLTGDHLRAARAALTQPASSPRPAPDPCEVSEARPAQEA